jgi:hypothetical protein
MSSRSAPRWRRFRFFRPCPLLDAHAMAPVHNRSQTAARALHAGVRTSDDGAQHAPLRFPDSRASIPLSPTGSGACARCAERMVNASWLGLDLRAQGAALFRAASLRQRSGGRFARWQARWGRAPRERGPS